MLEAAHLAGQVVGQQVELHAALGGHLVGDLLAALVARVAGVGLELLDAEALLGAARPASSSAISEKAPPRSPCSSSSSRSQAQLVEELAQSLDLLAVGASASPG